jgi:hypothetical protein
VRKFWLSPKTVGFAIPLLVGVALEIGGWVSHAIAYTLFACSFVWLMLALIYWRKHRNDEARLAVLAEAIKPELLERLKATGRLEDVSQEDALWIVTKGIEMEASHGYNDVMGLFADRASGVPLNKLMTNPCSRCGIPRNQKGKQIE